ncbi:MAG: hypothetical protein IJ463_07685 [Bacilli bacterium]|nr:hypothetical protein [Bacilli bacterium]
MNYCSQCNKEINTNENICEECKIKNKLQNAEDVICSCCKSKVSNIKDVCPICGSSLLGSKTTSQIKNEKKYYKEHAVEIDNEKAKSKSDFFSLIGIITFAIPFLIIFLSIGSFGSTSSTGIGGIGGIFLGLFLLLIFMPISIICRIISYNYKKQIKK